MPKKLTTEEFIRRARLVHGEKYDYSKVCYIDYQTPVCIICPLHGEFFQKPANHLSGRDCRRCSCIKNGEKYALTTEEFIKRAKLVHGEKYDYSKVIYVNARTKVCIVCPVHGEFWQKPYCHLKGNGCKLCSDHKAGDRTRFSHKEFLFNARRKHGNKYEYQTRYINSQTRMTITCPIHGNFIQVSSLHLHGSGCPVCGSQRTGDAHFLGAKHHINEAIKIHGDKYDYSLVPVDAKSTDAVPIICHKHGVFYQKLQHHKRGCGCPHCQKSFGEERINLFLTSNGVDFCRQYKIYNEDLLCQNACFYVDFFIPQKNTVIEFNGRQHYYSVRRFGGDEKFIKQQERDLALKYYCKRHKIKFIEIPYNEYNNIEKILKKELKIKNKTAV